MTTEQKDRRMPEVWRYRLIALQHAFNSSAAWKRNDAEMTDDPAESLACRREAQAYESCAGNIQAWIREIAIYENS